MNKLDISELLENKYSKLIDFYKNQDIEKWTKGPPQKWTNGQVALHLLQSIVPLNNALSLPKIILRLKFGKSNRPVRDYETVCQRYKSKLNDAGPVTYKGSAQMKVPSNTEKQYILNRLQVEQKKLQYKTQKIKDKQLDNFILPHPLMGKMPLREIIMWSAYHVEHHQQILDEQYSIT